MIYVDNNPVERHLVQKAEDYRWNYLAYANSNHPFSEALIEEKASKQMQMAIQIVNAWHKEGKYLSYYLLKKMFTPLNTVEKCQLVDHIVSTYNVLDYEGAARYFDGYDNMIAANHSVTGSEYDLNEVFIAKSDACYSIMTSTLMKTGRFADIHDIFSLPMEGKMELFHMLNAKTDATLEQIAKYLHIPFKYQDQ